MNLPQCEMRDVLQFAKTEMKQGETESTQFESVIKNEMLVKEYKTLKGLINNLKKQYTQQFNYNILTTI